MKTRPTRAAAPRRPAYTLLEMVLALSIALIILGAIYEFLYRQITLAEAGRELVDETVLARRILEGMSADIIACLGGVDPKQLPDPATSTDYAAYGQTAPFVPLFNGGVEGTDTVLIMSTARVPRELLAADKRQLESSALERVSDLRRISYWYVDDGASSYLAKQELTDVTGDDSLVKAPDISDPTKFKVMAEEVAGIMFEYFDGAAWQSYWSGSDLADDGATPIGPPSAIRITLTMRSRDGQRTRDYKRTVALPAGNNFPAQQTGF
jgi:type II secretory pathway pseudopilin PulG